MSPRAVEQKQNQLAVDPRGLLKKAGENFYIRKRTDLISVLLMFLFFRRGLLRGGRNVALR